MHKFICSLFLLCLASIPNYGFCQSNTLSSSVTLIQPLCNKVTQRPFKKIEDNSKEAKKLDEPFRSIANGIGYTETIRLMKNKNIDQISKVSETFDLYATPLIYAVTAGNWPATKALLDMGADVNLKASTSPLEISVSWSRFDLVCQLIQRGAKLPKRTEEKQSLLGLAVIVDPEYYEDSAIFIEYLLKNGFDINKLDHTTPLIQSASLGNKPAVEVLLKYGADIHLQNKSGETALDVAKKYKRKNIIELLEKAEQRQLKKAA